jgi:hypothetical protein
MPRILILSAAVLALAGPARSASPTYSAHVTNPWFPLAPGSRYIYSGIKDGQRSREVLTVTQRRKTISGKPCAVVEDRLFVRGRLAERTTDWYTQDAQGNVWYYGEETATLDRKGHVTGTSGTWRAGVAGAQPGIYMPAHPRVGQTGRQEYFKGEAEDHFKVLSLLGTNAVLTQEWTPLEPRVIDHKLYVRGIGVVLEQAQRGGNERNELVSFRRLS